MRAVVEKRAPVRRRREQRPRRGRRTPRGLRRWCRPRVARTNVAHRRQRDVTPIEQSRERVARAPAVLTRANSSRTCSSSRIRRARGAQRQLERLVREPRHLGLVGDFERRDRRRPRAGTRAAGRSRTRRSSRSECRRSARAARASAPAVSAPSSARWRELGEHAVAHLGGGLARERDRQDVPRIDARLDEPDVAVDEHARLARAGRRLEDDVVGRIDGEVARRLVGRTRRRRPPASIKQARLRHRPPARYSLRHTPA